MNSDPNPTTIRGVLETAIDVADLAAAERFYAEVLGLEVFVREHPRHVFFRLGGAMFLLFNREESSKPGELPPHGAQGPQHVAFRVPLAELDAWRERLEQKGVAIEKDYRWPRGGRSLYFRDPDGNLVELATPLIWGIAEKE